MTLPVPQFRPPPLPEPTPIVSVVERGEAPWNRPIFKAPLLEVRPWFIDRAELAEDLRRIGRGER